MKIETKTPWKSIWQGDDTPVDEKLYSRDITLEKYLETLPANMRSQAEEAIRFYFKDIKKNMNSYKAFHISLGILGNFQIRPSVFKNKLRSTIRRIRKYPAQRETATPDLSKMARLRNQIAYILKYKKAPLKSLLASQKLLIPIPNRSTITNPIDTTDHES